jgi:hypothetical protein
MADNIPIKDADDVTVPVSTVDKTAAGNGELQLVGLDYGVGTARQVLTEKPATEAAQTTGNASLTAIDGKLPALSGGRVPVEATGPLTDTQLRATAVPVSGPLTDTQLRATAVPVSGPLTDTQLRATAVPVSGPLTDTQLRATAVPVSGPLTDTQLRAAALPLPSGAASETTLAAVNAKIPALLTTVPPNNASAPPVRAVGQDVWACSFAAVGASVLSPEFTAPIVGAGVTYNQGAGALNILTGTNTNAEFLTRSTQSWRGSLRMRASLVASQRIVNQNLQIALADLIGEGLTYNIVSATVVDVTLAAHGYTAQNVGQSMNLGGITGAAGVPGRYAIASIPDANTIRFTVAGWPASGTGTLTLFGWNYVRNLFAGATATAMNWDAQRRGWASGDTTPTSLTTASPGVIVQNDLNGRDAFLANQLRASAAAPNFVTLASRYENIPDDDVVLYVFVWNYNGTVAPASTTTWTIGFISVEKFANTPVYVQGQRAQGAQNAAPVTLVGSALTANQTINLAQVGGTATVNGGVAGTLAVGGNVAEDAAATSNPLIVGGVARTALPASTVVAGDAVRATFSTSGQLVQKPYAVPDLDFTVNATVTTNTQTAIRAAQGATVRQNITQITFQNTNATATTLTIQEASNTLIQVSCPANMANPVQLQFPTPLRSGLNAALNYQAGTTGASVLLNVTGFNSN